MRVAGLVPVTPDEVRKLRRLQDEIRQHQSSLTGFLAIGNISAAQAHAQWLANKARALDGLLGRWPETVGTFQLADSECPKCGGQEVKAFNLYSLSSPAFHLCAACDHDWPAEKRGFYGSLPAPGVYAFGPILGGPAVAVLTASSPADAAAMFQTVQGVRLTLNRETPGDWQFLQWKGDSSAAGQVQMRRVRDLREGEELSQHLTSIEAVALPLAHGWTVSVDDDQEEGEE